MDRGNRVSDFFIGASFCSRKSRKTCLKNSFPFFRKNRQELGPKYKSSRVMFLISLRNFNARYTVLI